MAKVILSWTIAPPLTPRTEGWLAQWPATLRRDGLRGTFCVSADFLLSLEAAGRFDVLDDLAWHETGLRFVPPAGPGPATASQDWWEATLRTAVEAIAEQLAILKGLLNHHPRAIAVAPADFSPAIGLAASRQGIPLVAHAPFEDTPVGTPLAFCGGIYLCRHLEAAPIFPDNRPVDAWLHDCREVCRRFGDDRVLLVGDDLGALAGRLEQTGDTAAWTERLLQFSRALGQADLPLTTCGDLSRRPPPDETAYLQPEQVLELARQVQSCLRPLAVGGRWYSLAELLAIFLQAGAQHLARGRLEERIYPHRLLGPVVPSPALGELLLRRDELLAACRDCWQSIFRRGAVPPVLHVFGTPTTPSALLYAAAQALVDDTSSMVKIPPGPLPQLHATRREIRQVADTLAETGTPQGRLVRNAILGQCWTARPWA